MNISEIIPQPKTWMVKPEKSRHEQLSGFECGRKPITIAEHAKDPMKAAFFYNQNLSGMDPWTEVSGVDSSIDGKEYWLEYGVDRSKKVGPDYVVWVQA